MPRSESKPYENWPSWITSQVPGNIDGTTKEQLCKDPLAASMPCGRGPDKQFSAKGQFSGQREPLTLGCRPLLPMAKQEGAGHPASQDTRPRVFSTSSEVDLEAAEVSSSNLYKTKLEGLHRMRWLGDHLPGVKIGL